MTEVVLIYPYFKPSHDKSIFRFPPLGLGYIASHLRMNGISVEIVDCTFMTEKDALNRVRESHPSVIGIYSMYTMEKASLRLAGLLKDRCDLLVAGGPLPTVYPDRFLQTFDVVARGEGEQTMLELITASRKERGLLDIDGIAYRKAEANNHQSRNSNGSNIVYNPSRQLILDLDSIPFPARDLFENEAYKDYCKKNYGYSVTSMMTSRGCPFSCDFCSKPVFGDIARLRSPKNVVDEIENILSFGYDCIFFQDDCFTLNEERVSEICNEIQDRKLDFRWKCLSRVDLVKRETLFKMRGAGCERIFFGIESGNNSVLKIMKKHFTADQARKAVELTTSAGIETGAFFILGYPGETDGTVLDTIRFATSLPLDYLSFTLPYPIPGTGLYEKVKDKIKNQTYSTPHHSLIDHSLNFQASFSEIKLKFAIQKATIQYRIRKHQSKLIYALLGKPFEMITDIIFKVLK